MGNLAQEFGAVGEPAQVGIMNENNAEWMSLYPFSAVRFFVFSFLVASLISGNCSSWRLTRFNCQ